MKIYTTWGYMEYDPTGDGTKWINCYSRGQTPLGRDLTNLSDIGFTHPEYGQFNSMEGYWHWVSTGCKHPAFKTLRAWEAKERSRNTSLYPKVRVSNFEELIRTGLHLKLEQNPILANRLGECTLPLAHYYAYPGNVLDIPKNQIFWLESLEELRGCYDF